MDHQSFRVSEISVRKGALPAIVFGAIVACCCSAANAQLTPDRVYYGIDRPAPMTVAKPTDAEGELRIDLFRPPHSGKHDLGTPLFSSPVVPGKVDMASLFPELWKTSAPGMLYAQLVVGQTRIGPAVVLRPMVSPPLPMLWSESDAKPFYLDPRTRQPSMDARRGTVIFTPDAAAIYSGIEAWVDQHAVMDTEFGPIEFRLRPDEAPNTVRNFMRLIEGGFYTDIAFHRIVPTLPSGAPFVVQVGDPAGTGAGGPGYAIDLEDTHLPHDFGVLSMARDSDPNTNGSQVFICLSREGTQFLDGKYTSFAEAVSGAETILELARTPVNGDKPIKAPKLLGVRLVDAPPLGAGPRPVLRPAAANGKGATTDTPAR